MEWRVVEEFPTYEVCNLGMVRNAKTKWILATYLCHTGYRQVSLSGKGRTYSRRVHLLVAKAFLGPKPGKNYVVDHDDHNKGNPALSNLKWITQSENIKRAVAAGRFNPVPPNRRKYGENQFKGKGRSW